MKKRKGVFIFFILVLFISIISAEWWNPFGLGAPLTPEEICKKYSYGPFSSYPCTLDVTAPNVFVSNCLVDSINSFGSRLRIEDCNSYSPPAGYVSKAYYQLNCLRVSDKYPDVYCVVGNVRDLDCDGDEHSAIGVAINGLYCSKGKDCNDFDPTKKTECGSSSGGTSSGGLLASAGSAENYQQQMQQNLPLFSPVTLLSLRDKILIIIAIIFIIIVIGFYLKRKNNSDKKLARKNFLLKKSKIK